MIDLMELTAEDLADIEVLQKLRKEAEKLYRAVVNNQRVPLILDDMNRYKLWDDSNNAEYLTLKDGEWIWQARYLHQSYDVPINKEKIYRIMVSGYQQRKDKSMIGFTNTYDEAIDYFKSYVSKLEKIAINPMFRGSFERRR